MILVNHTYLQGQQMISAAAPQQSSATLQGKHKIPQKQSAQSSKILQGRQKTSPQKPMIDDGYLEKKEVAGLFESLL